LDRADKELALARCLAAAPRALEQNDDELLELRMCRMLLLLVPNLE